MRAKALGRILVTLRAPWWETHLPELTADAWYPGPCSARGAGLSPYSVDLRHECLGTDRWAHVPCRLLTLGHLDLWRLDVAVGTRHLAEEVMDAVGLEFVADGPRAASNRNPEQNIFCVIKIIILTRETIWL